MPSVYEAIADDAESEQKNPFVEGVDFYYEGGLMVVTRHFLLRRGYCCENGCRHCPYKDEVVSE